MGEQMHWTIDSPIATHWRRATCEEVDCAKHRTGYRIRVDALAEADLDAIRQSNRPFTVLDVAEGETYWVFPPGTPCFEASLHQVPVGRPELYVVRDRGEVRRYDRADQWAEDCATHTTKIVDKIKEG